MPRHCPYMTPPLSSACTWDLFYAGNGVLAVLVRYIIGLGLAAIGGSLYYT